MVFSVIVARRMIAEGLEGLQCLTTPSPSGRSLKLEVWDRSGRRFWGFYDLTKIYDLGAMAGIVACLQRQFNLTST